MKHPPLGSTAITIDFRVLALFFAGSVGAVSFSIKWLVHACAKGTWHIDRRLWRLLTPFLGGAYACVVLTLFDAGILRGQASTTTTPLPTAAAFAFLIGYFSDGVSGLLSNIANSLFGTLNKKSSIKFSSLKKRVLGIGHPPSWPNKTLAQKVRFSPLCLVRGLFLLPSCPLQSYSMG
jgi:hypothetical protein